MVVDQLGDPVVADLLRPITGCNMAISTTCGEVLKDLAKALYELYEMPKDVIKKDQFVRLAERVVNEPEYGGSKAQSDARREVNNLKNTTPEEDWPRRIEEEINASGNRISDMKYGSMVLRYLSHNYNINNNYGGLGRFLNTFRRDISETELNNLMKQLFRIIYLREDKEQLEAAREEEQVSAQPNAGSRKDARAIFNERKTTKPCTPKLPNFFSEKLANNAAALECYYATLHHCGFYIGRTLLKQEKKDPESSRYEGWKWKHLREAFVKLDFIAADSPKKGFAKHIAAVFPCLEFTNIQRGFNSRGGYYEDEKASKRIISDIIAEFQPVKDLM
jgi:hypothetical protein